MLRGLILLPCCLGAYTVALCQNPTPPQTQSPAQTPGQSPNLNQPNGPPPYLTLEDALRMAQARNGDVKAEAHNVNAADASVKQAYGAFFPTVTVQAGYGNDFFTGNSGGGAVGSSGGGSGNGGGSNGNGSGSGRGSGNFTTTGANSNVTGSWEILDTGEREYAFLGARRSYQAEQATYRQTLRQTLFTVSQDYFNTLRAEEQEKVDEAATQRAATILDQTQASVTLGASPEKDILQARADYLNAKVQELIDKNANASAQANLKDVIGWDKSTPLPTLMTYPEPTNVQPAKSLQDTIAEGLKNRPDLISDRFKIQSAHYAYLSAQQDAYVTLDFSTQASASFSPSVNQDRQFGLQLVIPLYDGGVLREKARQLHEQEFMAEDSLVQRERDARAAIETDYITVTQDAERVQAAKLALDAARLNYQAESEAQKLGAQSSTVITVLTAEVSLVTAESAYVAAIYDYYIADAQLRLDTGRAMIAEPTPVPHGK